MKILISGASGLIGAALSQFLGASGHQVAPLVRRKPGTSSASIYWDPATGVIEQEKLSGLDAVVHLAGESIASGRWTSARKQRIRTSRIDGTKLLVSALQKTAQRPKVLISASAIGYYGNRGDEILHESSPMGRGFLAELARDWEEESQLLSTLGVRVVNPRIGIVLSAKGGALAKMLPAFKLCLGGPLGDGTHYMSWIALEDLLRIFDFFLSEPRVSGPINCVAPQAVSNFEFTKTLGRVLHRPTFFSVPKFVLQLLFGELADEALLASTRAAPTRLTELGFAFSYPTLEQALAHCLA